MNPEEDDPLPAYMTPLYIAIFINHDLTKARDLINSGNAIDDEPADDGYTLLHHAVQTGNIKALKFLLKNECAQSIKSFDYIEHTPLIWAASEGRLEMARLLIQAGADVNANHGEKIGNTAIREAVRAGDLRMCELLLECGADPSIPGWMRIDAILQARMSLEENPESELRARILSLVSSWKK